MIERLLRRIGAITPDEKLIRVKSWRVEIERTSTGWRVLWPVMLLDRKRGRRETVWPIWFET